MFTLSTLGERKAEAEEDDEEDTKREKQTQKRLYNLENMRL